MTYYTQNVFEATNDNTKRTNTVCRPDINPSVSTAANAAVMLFHYTMEQSEI